MSKSRPRRGSFEGLASKSRVRRDSNEDQSPSKRPRAVKYGTHRDYYDRKQGRTILVQFIIVPSKSEFKQMIDHAVAKEEEKEKEKKKAAALERRMTLRALKRDLKSSNISGVTTPGEFDNLNNKE